MRVIHAGFEDPPALAGQAKEDPKRDASRLGTLEEQEALAIYRRVRDGIRRFIEELPRVLEANGSRPPQ